MVDAHLIAIDHAVLGVDAGRWLNDHIGSPVMTEILVICYASYGFATPVYAAYLYLKDKTRPFRDLSLAITLTAVLGYIGYVSVPAIGPYLFQKEIYPDRLPQWSADPGLLDTINNLKGTARDCFPSLHTAMTTVLMALMWKSARRMFWGYLPMALGLYLATLYLRVHYAVDIAAGFVTAAVVLVLTPGSTTGGTPAGPRRKRCPTTGVNPRTPRVGLWSPLQLETLLVKSQRPR